MVDRRDACPTVEVEIASLGWIPACAGMTGKR